MYVQHVHRLRIISAPFTYARYVTAEDRAARRGAGVRSPGNCAGILLRLHCSEERIGIITLFMHTILSVQQFSRDDPRWTITGQQKAIKCTMQIGLENKDEPIHSPSKRRFRYSTRYFLFSFLCRQPALESQESSRAHIVSGNARWKRGKIFSRRFISWIAQMAEPEAKLRDLSSQRDSEKKTVNCNKWGDKKRWVGLFERTTSWIRVGLPGTSVIRFPRLCVERSRISGPPPGQSTTHMTVNVSSVFPSLSNSVVSSVDLSALEFPCKLAIKEMHFHLLAGSSCVITAVTWLRGGGAEQWSAAKDVKSASARVLQPSADNYCLDWCRCTLRHRRKLIIHDLIIDQLSHLECRRPRSPRSRSDNAITIPEAVWCWD
ncbi:hypothetical protein J6590_003446 [Homalodisca vitripennis]|nr:hypothetical protein J6590_003446 [Homalodisca vitripennis]